MSFIPCRLPPVIALAGLCLLASEVVAQSATSAPAVAVQGSCRPISFDRSTFNSILRFDVVVRVDESGAVVSTESLGETTNPALLREVESVAASCRFRPALVNGAPAAGLARMLFVVYPLTLAAPDSRPGIGDVKSCAPSPADYPAESIMRNETGTTRLTFTIDDKAQLTAFGVARSSGHVNLDFVALKKLTTCQFRVGKTAEGAPVGGTATVDFVWKIE